jgi:hypothetical protein
MSWPGACTCGHLVLDPVTQTQHLRCDAIVNLGKTVDSCESKPYGGSRFGVDRMVPADRGYRVQCGSMF